jgi:protein phosphatase
VIPNSIPQPVLVSMALAAIVVLVYFLARRRADADASASTGAVDGEKSDQGADADATTDAASTAATASSSGDAATTADTKSPDTTTAATKNKKDRPPRIAPVAAELPKIAYDEDADVEPTLLGAAADAGAEPKRITFSPPTQKIVYDEDAADDEPTHSGAMILVTATAQTDKGNRRKRNEDSLLAREDQGIFVVADGMGGYRGGEIASQLAVTTIERAFSTKSFDGPAHDTIPPRASELARAIQMANEAIFQKASGDKMLEGMGTTICAARFSANKQRVYIGHVGDSRVYRLRHGKLRQMTSDHTMQELGVKGDGAAHLSRAVGVWPVVPIDIVLGKPHPGDVYLLCSDGLSKMVRDAQIEEVLLSSGTPEVAAEELVKAANERGGKDNITGIVVRVDDPAKSDRPRVAA